MRELYDELVIGIESNCMTYKVNRVRFQLEVLDQIAKSRNVHVELSVSLRLIWLVVLNKTKKIFASIFFKNPH